MEGGDAGAGEVGGEAFADLLGGLAVEGEDEDVARRDALVADEVGDLAGDDGGLARARAGEHERDVLVGGDGGCLLVGRGVGEHARGRVGNGGQARVDEAVVGLLARPLEGAGAREGADASERPGGVRGQVRARQRSGHLLRGGGDVRLEFLAAGVAAVALSAVVAGEALAELQQVGGDLAGGAGRLLADGLGEPFGVCAGEPADGVDGAPGLADGEARPEPRRARLDAVDGAHWDGGAAREAEHAALEHDAGWPAREQADEGGAGGGDRRHRWSGLLGVG